MDNQDNLDHQPDGQTPKDSPQPSSDPPAGGTGNIFADLSKLRIGQDLDSMVSAKKILIKIPVRKPSKEWWVRTHPDTDYSIDCYLLELKDSSDSFGSELYFVVPEVAQALDGESTIRQTKLITTINRQGVLFLWPIKLPNPGKRPNDWTQSALEIATGPAATAWVRVTPNGSLGAYECFDASGQFSEPSWPEDEFSEMLRIAFHGRIIDSVQHDVLRSLRGEM